MADINPNVAIITLNMNGINNQKSEIVRIDKQQDPTTCCL